MEELILIAPAFNIIGVRAPEISTEQREQWKRTGSMPWDDDPVHSDWPLSWKWVEERKRFGGGRCRPADL